MNKHQLLLALNGLEHWLLDGSEEARLGLKRHRCAEGEDKG